MFWEAPAQTADVFYVKQSNQRIGNGGNDLKKKPVFSRELAYICGVYILTMGTAFIEKANLGMSMVVAPAYVLSLKFQPLMHFLTFGFFEYMIQAVMLIVLALALRTWKRSWIFSFVTAFLSGNAIDLNCYLLRSLTADTLGIRILCFVIGLLLGSLGIAFLYHTYIPLEVYDIVILEIVDRKKSSVSKVKTTYDCISCAAAIAISFVFFHGLRGVYICTVICALVNGTCIGTWTKILDRCFTFKDTTKLRSFFEK